MTLRDLPIAQLVQQFSSPLLLVGFVPAKELLSLI